MAVPTLPRPDDDRSAVLPTREIATPTSETAIRSDETTLSQLLQRLQIVATHATDLILILDAALQPASSAPIVYASPAVSRMTGYTASEVVGRTFELLQTAGEASEQAAIVCYHPAEPAAVSVERTLQRKDGSLFPAELEFVSYADQPDVAGRTVIVVRDISARKQMDELLAAQTAQLQDAVARLTSLSLQLEEARAQLEAQSITDRLTGLHNYGALQDVLEREFQQVQQTGVPLAFAIIDLDLFHKYNQTYGYTAGDEALKVMAYLLHRHVRSSDFTARYSGDEFAMMLPETEQTVAVQLAEDIRAALEAIPWLEHPLTVSIGIAMVTEQTREAATLVAHAELALFHCKKRGRNCVSCYTDVPRDLHARAFTDALRTLADQAGGAMGLAGSGDEGLSGMQMRSVYDVTIAGWSRILDLRDHETEGHSERVTEMTERLASALAVPEKERDYLRWGALLHDIGKIAVPDSILRKPGPLTEIEWEVMRRHPQHAYEMLAPIDYLNPALAIPWCHHEKWDGSGYPHGLIGEQIPLAARIFAVVDVYDALRSDRPYRAGWPEDQVRDYIRTHSGSHFDPAIVEAFMAMLAADAAATETTAAVSAALEPRVRSGAPAACKPG